MVASHMPPIGDLPRNPGMCPDWESNRQPFASQASTESTELHQPGPQCICMNLFIFRERGREGERERETSVCSCLLCTLYWATQACALTGNQTGNPLVLRPALNPLSYTSQGHIYLLSEKLSIFFSDLLLPITGYVEVCCSISKNIELRLSAKMEV